jgi:hypothetical protein
MKRLLAPKLRRKLNLRRSVKNNFHMGQGNSAPERHPPSLRQLSAATSVFPSQERGMRDLTDANLQNEVEHLRAVCAQQDGELAKVKASYECLRTFTNDLLESGRQDIEMIERLQNIRDDLHAAAGRDAEEIERLRAIIEQMLAETGSGGTRSVAITD